MSELRRMRQLASGESEDEDRRLNGPVADLTPSTVREREVRPMYTIRPWLLVGAYAETRDAARLAAAGVRAMLQLADPVPQPGVASLYLAVDDGAPIPPAAPAEGLAFVRRAREAGDAVLVACGAGVSRSVAFAAAALKEAEGMGVLDAVSAVRARHPAAQPHYRLLGSLCAYYGGPASTEDLVRAWTGQPPAPAWAVPMSPR